MQNPAPVPRPEVITAHVAALRLIDALYAIGIEITSVREAVPEIGERGVRVGVLAVEDVLTLCDLLRAEESRRAAEAAEAAEGDGGEGGER